jgi:hypothetical protein
MTNPADPTGVTKCRGGRRWSLIEEYHLIRAWPWNRYPVISRAALGNVPPTGAGPVKARA